MSNLKGVFCECCWKKRFVCVCALSAIWAWHMSCPMLWVLPLSCNNTPHCRLKYSWPGKPITLSQSHGFLIITPPPPSLTPQVTVFPLIPLTAQLRSAPCTATRCWASDSKSHSFTLQWFICVGFHKAGFRIHVSILSAFLFLITVLTLGGNLSEPHCIWCIFNAAHSQSLKNSHLIDLVYYCVIHKLCSRP